MVKKKVIITDKDGLHARPASQFSKEASKLPGDITLMFKDKSINLKSVLAIMSLAVPKDSEITISVDGDDEENTLEHLIQHLKTLKLID